ncbi:hypothetical protein [Pseudochrobactrum asaccharolyticum]|uniref:hypothetical protein n=1 Tax=Pseudochrobactrum asaccharolyticum TaxID=354351 RepID=UPI000DEBADCC|nr:hypothetical protein [Pseudochrobactrum asaccharolyticum]
MFVHSNHGLFKNLHQQYDDEKLSKRWIVSICRGWPETANPQMIMCHIKTCNNDSYAAKSVPDPVNNIMIIFIIFKVTPIIVM